MPDPYRERMDAISKALAALVQWQERTDQRLARIEQALGLQAPPPPLPTSATIEKEIESPVPVPPPREQKPGIETSVGLTWLSRAGVLTLVLGIAFFFKYAVDNQWIGERGRVMLGVVGALGALGIGERFWRAGHKVYAQGISGGGIATLYLSFYAAFAYYRLIGAAVSFGLLALTTTAAGALSLRYGSAVIAAMCLVGGYATPLLLSTGEDRPWFLFSYVALVTAAAFGLVRLRGWRWLEILAFCGTGAVYLAWFDQHYTPEKRVVATIFAILFYGIFALCSRRSLVILAQVLAGLALVSIWPAPRLTYLVLSVAISAAGLLVAARRNWSRLPSVTGGTFWLYYGVWQLDVRQPPVLGEFLLMTGGGLLFLGWMLWRDRVSESESKEDLALTALNAATYFAFSYIVLGAGFENYRGPLALSLAAIYGALGWWSRRRAAALFLGIAICLVTLAIPIHLSAWRITIAWTLEAAAVTWIGRAHTRIIYASLLLFGGVLFRLFFVDSTMSFAETLLFNGRFLTFITVAISLWATAWWAQPARVRLAAYLAAHFVMIWALVLEVLSWCARSIAPESLKSVETTAISILLALYATMLVTAGLVAPGTSAARPVNRFLGLGLIGLVVIKLYSYDLVVLGSTYRIWAFAILGLLMLAMSFLYSRYRTALENWWRQARGRRASE